MPSRLLKRKIHCKNGYEPNKKHWKAIVPENSTTSTDVAAITSICNELLERIFNLLDLQSLLNVAGTCKRLRVAAAAEFNRKFGRYAIFLHSNDYSAKCSDSLKKGFRFNIINCIEVYGPTVLPFLRCFGSQVSELAVYGSVFNYGMQYINRYCADTLTILEFMYVDKEMFSIENIPKQFKMIETVTVYGDTPNLGEEFSNFTFWFPNLQKFSLNIKCIDNGFCSVCLPNMYELWLGRQLDSYSKRKYVERFLQANPQLQCLETTTPDLTFSKLLDITSKNSLISKLDIWKRPSRLQVGTGKPLRLAKQLPMLVTLDLKSYVFRVNDVIAVIRQLCSLKYFRFRLKNRTEYQQLLNRLKPMIRYQAKLDLNFSQATMVELKFNQ